MELKTVRGKIGFFKFIWELEFWKLNLRTWVLKIGVLKIKFERNWIVKIKFKNLSFGNYNWKKLEIWKLFENWNFENLNLRIGILEIKFERKHNFENYLRSRNYES